MSSFIKNIKPNSIDSHQRSPSWCIAVSSFKRPAAMYNAGETGIYDTKKLLVIENDAIEVNISRPKSGFGKTANITLKVTDVNYQNQIAPGDWIFIWMSDWQEDIDGIIDALYNLSDKSKAMKLNGFNSGLKFVGRVMEIPSSDTVTFSGIRTIVQNIHCQAHIELASSVYYTFMAQIAINPGQNTPELTGARLLVQNNAKILTDALKKSESAQTKDSEELKKNQNARKETSKPGIRKTGTEIAEKVLGYYDKTKEWTPDSMISLMLLLLLGIDRDQNLVNKLGAKGTFQDAIGIPQSVAHILNRRKATKLWQTYTILMGIQKYNKSNSSIGAGLNPIFEESYAPGNVFYRTTKRCRGIVPFVYSPILDNGTIWSTISQYLNPVVNEMYTALRVNPEGLILPTLIVREQPFSTNLYNNITGYMKHEMDTIKETEKKRREAIQKYDDTTATTVKKEDPDGIDVTDIKIVYDDQKPADDSGVNKIKEELVQIATDQPSTPDYDDIRTMFSELPRWIVPESMITAVNVSTSESKRINFVQVWGRSKGAEFAYGGGLPMETIKRAQYTNINYAADEKDISRNGLRADITETQFDMIYNPDKTKLATLAPLFAKMRADWLFNGHLKPYGTISCIGIKDPICEGDNVQIRGVVYHIEGVSFNGSIGVDGRKNFSTSLQVSNGILASSIDTNSKKVMPSYPRAFGSLRYGSDIGDYEMPGVTNVQNTRISKGYDSDGEQYSHPENDNSEE